MITALLYAPDLHASHPSPGRLVDGDNLEHLFNTPQADNVLE